MCTGFDGNSDCADAPPPIASIAAVAAAIRKHLPMAVSRYSRCLFYGTPDSMACRCDLPQSHAAQGT
jgi:hypothetical protein